MKLLREGVRRLTASPRALTAIVLSLFGALIPTAAFAGEADVRLDFSQNGGTTYLWISIGFGIAALIFAALMSRSVLASSPGNEKMQAVGLAIREGALAYLKRQIMTMVWFVAAIAVGLYFLQNNIFVSIAFIGGVAASYIAGYTGMLMAVNGNMRTAHAALSSYKKSLEVAFHSGAVAGMVTVGMGLLGATIILMFGGPSAMMLLVGFGFGGSLAALFMRVGGGIFTKAADVGADLVGKVEAGIPEDDPRNPATIADNVGDNVGDCAGMAADIFESYEVTLVAAIVLGAATAEIFDTQTWMRLILFALMARGVGIVASAIGILAVRGSDDLDADPLKAIRKGFYASAGIALLATAFLAWYMMGGKTPLATSRLVTADELHQRQAKLAVAARQHLAGTNEPWTVSPKLLAGDSSLKAIGADQQPDQAPPGTSADQAKSQAIMQLLQNDFAIEQGNAIPYKILAGFSQLDPQSQNPALKYSIRQIPRSQAEEQTINAQGANPKFVSLKDAFTAGDLDLVVVEYERSAPATPGQPAPKPQTFYAGPMHRQYFEDLKAKGGPNGIKIAKSYPAALYADGNGNVAIGADMPIEDIPKVSAFGVTRVIEATPEQITDILKKNQDPANVGNSGQPMVQQLDHSMAGVEHKDVPWYDFFIAIAFGVFMAFAIEWLTDYYVSTHKRPTQEVAGVSSAGPAPMIIQGFAYAAESSVFMVVAIVIALLVPLYLFSPAEYGSPILSFYGIALVGLGLLTTTGYVLAMDTFGPISDNAQGVFEMSGAGHDSETGSKAVQRLDAAGNTTKALTKGFAIATAVVAAVALYHSYLHDAKLEVIGLRLDTPEIFLGLLIGGAAPYLFSAFAINAVGRAAFQLINEVRRQFKADPGIMAGTSKPNYGVCVSIVTSAAQKELLGPGILAIFLPIAVAFGFSIGKEPTMIGGHPYNLVGAQALGGFLAGAILSGQLLAVLLANSGGMWDNAKKIIEDGLYGGKGSEAHKAGIVCDTVGDPFKDTAGPAMNPLIKVMNLVALLLAPFIIRPFGNTVLSVITGVSLLLLIISIYFSKRGSLSTEMMKATEMAHDQAEKSIPEVIAEEHASDATRSKKRITVDEDDGKPE